MRDGEKSNFCQDCSEASKNNVKLCLLSQTIYSYQVFFLPNEFLQNKEKTAQNEK